MDAVDSLGLLLALLLGGAGAVAAAARAAGLLRGRSPAAVTRGLCLGCGTASLAVGAASSVVHLVFGHGPDSLEPMSASPFLLFHRSYWAALALALLALAGATLPARAGRTRNGQGR